MSAELKFSDLRFSESEDHIRVKFYRIFYFDIDKPVLSGREYRVFPDKIVFEGTSEKEASEFFNRIIDSGMTRLINSVNGRKTVFLHKNMGIPLLGCNTFGIVVRNSNLVEIKPICGCNLNCTYCSLSEGKSENLALDYVIEPYFLADELGSVLDMLECDEFEVHIGCQGEPLLYSKLNELVAAVSSLKKVKSVSMDTNGTLLSEKKVDELISSGMTQINLSIDSMDQQLASEIAGECYDLSKVLAVAEYIASKGKLLIAPLYLPGVNDEEMRKLILFAKGLGARIGIQNFLPYKFGRRPVRGISMERFYKKLREWEKEFGMKLVMSAEDFGIRKIAPLKKPFFKGNVIEAEIVFPGRRTGEMVGMCNGRLVTIAGAKKRNGTVRVKVTRDKHNVFYGEAV